jgi:hypothetical protein
MDAAKHLLSAVNCVIGLIFIWVGLIGARTQVDNHPWLAFVLAAAAIAFPIPVVTRVSWRAGFEAGRREGDRQ